MVVTGLELTPTDKTVPTLNMTYWSVVLAKLDKTCPAGSLHVVQLLQHEICRDFHASYTSTDQCKLRGIEKQDQKK